MLRTQINSWALVGDTITDRPAIGSPGLKQGNTFLDVATGALFQYVVSPVGVASWVGISDVGSPQPIDATLRYVADVLGVNTTQPNANSWVAEQTFEDGVAVSGGSTSITAGSGNNVILEAAPLGAVQIQDADKNVLVQAGPTIAQLQIGFTQPGSQVTYAGGTLVPAQLRTTNFTFGQASTGAVGGETADQIDTTGLTGTLSSTDPVGTRYEIIMLASVATPNFTLTPNGGATISEPGGIAQASLNINMQAATALVEKQSDGNWLLTLGSAGPNAAPKYWCAPAGSSPAAPYNLPSQMVAAMVADGATGANPRTGFVLPGFYADPTFAPQDGCDIKGLSGHPSFQPFAGIGFTNSVAAIGDVFIQIGAVTVPLTCTQWTIDGIQFIQSGAGGGQFNFGANANAGAAFCFRNCGIDGLNAGDYVIKAAPTAAFSLYLENTTLYQISATGGGINFTTSAKLGWRNLSIVLTSGAQNAIQMTGGTRLGDGGQLTGTIKDLGVVTAFEAYVSQITTAAPYNIMFAGSTITKTGGTLSGAAAGASFTGTGTLNLYGVGSGDANGFGLPAAGTIACLMNEGSFLRPSTTVAGGAGNITIGAGNVLGDVYTFDCTAASRTLNLPAAATIPIGLIIRAVKIATGAFSIIVAPNGADTINGANSSITSGVLITGQVAVMRVAGAGTQWAVIAFS